MAGTGYFTGRILALSVIGLCLAAPPPAQAQIRSGKPADFITALTEQNIHEFLRESGEITTGQRPDMMDEDVANYFLNHMSERAKLKSHMTYEIPNFPAQENEMELGRNEYIDMVVNGRYMMENYTADIEIQNLKIAGSGKQATFTSTITEKGNMPFPSDPKKPDDLDMLPIEGRTVCEQKLIVSYNNFIQIAGAECETSINFDPFGGKPLVP